MIELFGFWLISLAITLFSIFLFGDELSMKEKICMVVMFQLFVGLLEIGLSLMGI